MNQYLHSQKWMLLLSARSIICHQTHAALRMLCGILDPQATQSEVPVAEITLCSNNHADILQEIGHRAQFPHKPEVPVYRPVSSLPFLLPLVLNPSRFLPHLFRLRVLVVWMGLVSMMDSRGASPKTKSTANRSSSIFSISHTL